MVLLLSAFIDTDNVCLISAFFSSNVIIYVKNPMQYRVCQEKEFLA